MEELIQRISDVQEDLIGIILTISITAIVSIITLIINSIVKISIENQKYNNEQRKIMQKFYPELKKRLFEIRILLDDVSNNPIYLQKKNFCIDYFNYKEDEKRFRETHDKNVEHIETYIVKISELIRTISSLSVFLKTTEIPFPPINHRKLKNNTTTMISSLQYYSFLVTQVENREISINTIESELKQKKDGTFSINTLDQYIKLLNKWYLKY